MFPTNNFATAQPSQVRFGLGEARKVDRLIVQWPSGTVQELQDIPVGMHIRVQEGNPEFEVLQRSSVGQAKSKRAP
jgi:hypothetical protein